MITFDMNPSKNQEKVIGNHSKTVAEAVRQTEISEQTNYTLRKKYGGMNVSDAKRLEESDFQRRKINIKPSTTTGASLPIFVTLLQYAARLGSMIFALNVGIVMLLSHIIATRNLG